MTTFSGIVPKAPRILKLGGHIFCYKMTVAPEIDFAMVAAVLKQIDLRASSTGSRSELKFDGENQIRPAISLTVKGWDNLMPPMHYLGI